MTILLVNDKFCAAKHCHFEQVLTSRYFSKTFNCTKYIVDISHNSFLFSRLASDLTKAHGSFISTTSKIVIALFAL